MDTILGSLHECFAKNFPTWPRFGYRCEHVLIALMTLSAVFHLSLGLLSGWVGEKRRKAFLALLEKTVCFGWMLLLSVAYTWKAVTLMAKALVGKTHGKKST